MFLFNNTVEILFLYVIKKVLLTLIKLENAIFSSTGPLMASKLVYFMINKCFVYGMFVLKIYLDNMLSENNLCLLPSHMLRNKIN